MKPQRSFPIHADRWLGVVLVTLALFAAIPARAATLYWPNVSTSGPWNTTTQNWGTSLAGPYNVAVWNNATPDSAQLGAGGVLTLGSNITAGRITTDWGPVTIQNSGGNTYSLTINGTSGTGIEHGNVSLTINVPVVMKSGAGLYRYSAGTMTVNGVISQTGGAWSLNESTGDVYLNGLNTYSGTTVVGGSNPSRNSRLYINTLKLKGEAQSTGMNNLIQLGYGDSANQHLIYSGGATTTDKDWRLGTSIAGTFTSGFFNNGTGAVIWKGVQQTVDVNATGARTLILGGTNTADNDWQSVIKNGYASGTSHNTSLRKDNAGKWILSGNNTYSGTTVINAGTLQVGSGGATGSLGSGNVTNNGNLVFNRTGTSTISLLAGTGKLFVNAGTLTVTSAVGDNSSSKTFVTVGGNTFHSTTPTLMRTVSGVDFGTTGANLGSTSLGSLGTSADLVDSFTVSRTVTMQWRTANSAIDITPPGFGLVSDVLRLTGLNGTNFVLQMSYKDDRLDGFAGMGGVYLGWWNGSAWTNAVAGNTGGAATFAGIQAYNTGLFNLGTWGVNTNGTGGTVWAVLNHNSDFAVLAVPEPSTLFLIVSGLATARWARRRRGKAEN